MQRVRALHFSLLLTFVLTIAAAGARLSLDMTGADGAETNDDFLLPSFLSRTHSGKGVSSANQRSSNASRERREPQSRKGSTAANQKRSRREVAHQPTSMTTRNNERNDRDGAVRTKDRNTKEKNATEPTATTGRWDKKKKKKANEEQRPAVTPMTPKIRPRRRRTEAAALS